MIGWIEEGQLLDSEKSKSLTRVEWTRS
jgi:hypothetical protein